MNERIEWFWAHRRKASLLHASFLMRGLAGTGWLPAVKFYFDHQIVAFVPDKGSYIFYDKNQLGPGAQKYLDIQESIDANAEFVRDFRRRTNELFGAVFFKCIEIDSENLQLLPQVELARLYQDFMEAIMVGPIITIQLWGIEACFDESYKIMTFLRSRLQELGKGREFEVYKSLLAVNIGETVAFTEQKNFYQIASKFSDNKEISGLFLSENPLTIRQRLTEFELENTLFEKHIQKYEWINTEYTGAGWSHEKWIDLFKAALTDAETPHAKLEKMLSNFKTLVQQREAAIEELNPPQDVRHALDALAELIAQRDWTKGYLTRALLSYHRILDEIARRFNVSREDLFLHTYKELDVALTNGKLLSESEIKNRKQHGAILVIKGEEFTCTTGAENIQRVIEKEGVSEPFEKLVSVTEFKGLSASRGYIRGKARVLENASDIPSLQEGEILVTYMTTIEFIPAFRKAAAVITDEGGMSCHAAIVSREFKLPCIVGTKVATRVLQTGDLIEVDADKGIVRIIETT